MHIVTSRLTTNLLKTIMYDYFYLPMIMCEIEAGAIDDKSTASVQYVQMGRKSNHDGTSTHYSARWSCP